MSEIPAPAWMALGGFIGLTSLFFGFLRPVDHNFFFQLMTFVGFGMAGFGFFKSRLSSKSVQQELEDRRMKMPAERGQMEVEIDIDDFRRNPQLRSQAMQPQKYQGHDDRATIYGHPRDYSGQARPTFNSATVQQEQRMQPNQATVPVSPHHNKSHAQVQRFCGNCGTPLLKEHKFCPICWARV